MEFNLYGFMARPALFLTSPETAHRIAVWFFKRPWLWRLLRRRLSLEDERLHVRLGPLNLNNPVGLAAGFDKNCEMSKGLLQLGFGYLTLGTITFKPREGNLKPRIWRCPGKSLVNSMGLPNVGVQQIITNLTKGKAKRSGPIIMSVSGLSVNEFVECFRQIEPFVDGAELNISSPNTAGVRIFQEVTTLSKLLDEIGKLRSSMKPVWVKIPPYFNEQEREKVLDIVEVCMKKSVDGITAINTKIVQEPRASIGTGGLSGPPIFEDMIRIVGEVYGQTQGKIPINACGGISSASNVWRALESGASSVQIYTALIYQGPALASKLNRALLQMLQTSKLGSLNDVTGTGAH